MPPVTPRAIFITSSNFRFSISDGLRNRQSQIVHRKSLVRAQRLVEIFGGLLGGAAKFGNLPLHFAGANFILRDAARLAGTGVDHGRCAGLELPRASSCHQNIAVVAVEAFDQLHGDSPLNSELRYWVPYMSAEHELREASGFRLAPLSACCRPDPLRALLQSYRENYERADGVKVRKDWRMGNSFSFRLARRRRSARSTIVFSCSERGRCSRCRRSEITMASNRSIDFSSLSLIRT